MTLGLACQQLAATVSSTPVIDKGAPEIVDPHMHVGDFPLFDVAMDRDGLVALFEEWGYAAGVVFHPDNALVRDLVEDVPNAWALYWANPRLNGCAEDCARFLEHPKFLGVKMHPLLDAYHPNDPAVHPVARVLIERAMPALIHCGHPIFTLPWSIEELIVEFPDLKVILGHMGHGNIIYINAAIDVAARHPNVWLETSGMPMHSKIRTAVERVGEDKVMYGSDAPFHDPGAEIRKVVASGLGVDQQRRVLGTNARRLFWGSDDAPVSTGPVGNDKQEGTDGA
jgi:predicted TIM-barrel fold metal-dependent hydrolase